MAASIRLSWPPFRSCISSFIIYTLCLASQDPSSIWSGLFYLVAHDGNGYIGRLIWCRCALLTSCPSVVSLCASRPQFSFSIWPISVEFCYAKSTYLMIVHWWTGLKHRRNDRIKVEGKAFCVPHPSHFCAPSLEGYSIDFGMREISDAEANTLQLRSFHCVHGAFCKKANKQRKNKDFFQVSCFFIPRCSICWSLTVSTRSRSLCGSTWASGSRSPSPAASTSTVQSAGRSLCATWRPPSLWPTVSKAPPTRRPVRGERTSRGGASPWQTGWRQRRWYLTGEPGGRGVQLKCQQ